MNGFSNCGQGLEVGDALTRSDRVARLIDCMREVVQASDLAFHIR
jgi:hypothetical protein